MSQNINRQTESLSSRNKSIVFFDGRCGLCDKVVQFILTMDKDKVFLFAPLQGQYAGQNLKEDYIKNQNTIVLVEGDHIYTKSDAVLRIITQLGSLWKCLLVLKIFPKNMRDNIYLFFSERRFVLFEKMDSCRIPNESEKERFLM